MKLHMEVGSWLRAGWNGGMNGCVNDMVYRCEGH